MQKDRWQEINRIFHAALDVPPEDRPRFVATESKDDPDLQSHVERLLEADAKDENYLESPLIPPGIFSSAFSDTPQLQPGQILCERFHILRTVGSGGMGQVFEAYDSELAVNVALKLIRPEIAANPQALARFRQEVRLARRITHPNVCRTYDLDRDTRPNPSGPPTNLVFLTMEFLPGETLAERFKRTPRLTQEEILAIARQIAAALDAAHALGIVHRDIKPGNIMLVPPGENSRQPARVVITDFGLARLDPVFSAGEHSITHHSSHSNQPIGTLAYMAPEQMDGRPISAATDIYAFGLILFEMATGQRAFPSSNLLSGIAQSLTGPAPSPTTLQPSLPESVEQAIHGCLRLNPEDRFQTAEAVLECLIGQAKPPAVAAIPSVKPQPESRSAHQPKLFVSRKSLLSYASIALLVAVSLFLLGERYSWWKGNPAVTPGALVYLAPVTNQTGEKSLDNITELLQASLEQSAHINLLDRGRAMDILQNMTKSPDTPITQPIGREIAMRANAPRVVFSTVTVSQGHYTLNIDIQRPDYTPGRFRDHWTRSFPWQLTANTNASAQSATIPQQLTSTLRDATDWIRKQAGESQNDIALLDILPEDVTTGNWQALTEYSDAERFARAGKLEQAVAALKDATRLDPSFAMGYGRLGDILNTLGRMQEGYQAYTDALTHESDYRLTRRERDRIRGISALDSGDYATAESAFRDYEEYFSHDYTGWFYRAYPLMMMGRTQEAIETLKRAFEIDPKRPSPAEHLVRCYIILGDSSEAQRWLGEVKKSGAPEDVPYYAGLILAAAHDTDGAERQFRLLTVSKPLLQVLGQSSEARLAANAGQMGMALRNLQTAAEIAANSDLIPNYATALLDQASIECAARQPDQCIHHLRKALSINPGPVNAIYASSVLGRALAGGSAIASADLFEELKAIDRSLPPTPLGMIGEIARLRIHGEILLAEALPNQALAEFRRAEALDAPMSDKEYIARAMLAIARSERSSKQSHQLEADAMNAYGNVALHAPFFWQQAHMVRPGIIPEETREFIRLANRLGIQSAQMNFEGVETKP